MSRIYITITGYIVDDSSVAQMIQALNGLIAEKKPEEIYMLISTPGGNVNSGIVLYNFLRSLPVKVITHNIGQVDSIGNVIFLAGDERYMAPATSFLFHGVVLNGPGPISLGKAQMNELMSQFEQDEKRIEAIVCERSKLSKQKLAGLFNRGESLGGEDALKYDLVTKIIVPSIPSDAESFVFSVNIASN
jgi:ATP-dependent Clp protease protease subunit